MPIFLRKIYSSIFISQAPKGAVKINLSFFSFTIFIKSSDVISIDII